MKKIILFFMTACASLFLFSGCGHEHEWKPATCTLPKTCSVCGETEGEPLGHDWKDATCTDPKTCARCGEKEGTTLAHDWQKQEVIAPTCEVSGYTAVVCSLCGATEKTDTTNMLGHDWTDATCTEPKTCVRCGKTQGEPLGHDNANASCTDEWTCTRCGETFSALGHDWKDASCTEPQTCSRCGETEGSPLGHTPADPVKENVKAATCVDAGQFEEVIYCSVCKEELKRKTVTEDALGHTVTSGVCARCGFEIYETISGRGDDVLSDISVGDGLYRVHITNSGSRNFVVRVYDKDEDRDLAVNTIGNYDGYYFLEGSAPYTFEIESNGNWTVTIERIGTTTETSFSGSGDYVTDIFSASSGTWQITHDGDHNFVVWLWTTDGRDLIVNEIGDYEGRKRLSIPSGSNALLVIEADGNWEIKPDD